jgi:hypothetical protein
LLPIGGLPVAPSKLKTKNARKSYKISEVKASKVLEIFEDLTGNPSI